MFLVQIERAKEMYQAKDPEGKSFTFMHCWNKLKLEQKWADLGCETSQKKTRRPQLQVQGHVHLELMKVSMLMKRRDQVIHHQGKEGQIVRRRRKHAGLEILTLKEKAFTWRQWKNYRQREKRPKRWERLRKNNVMMRGLR